jgi:hypothetical protein
VKLRDHNTRSERSTNFRWWYSRNQIYLLCRTDLEWTTHCRGWDFSLSKAALARLIFLLLERIRTLRIIMC